MLIVYAVTTFLSAALLFTIEPMVAKMVLPLLGGSPAVWNTCMVFFQAGLLAGYAYSHFLTRLRPLFQVAVHAAVLALPLAALPIGLRSGARPPAEGSPVPWLLWTLALSVGLPFFVLSTTGPLVQQWLSRTDHPEAADPYFLYAASNLGSLGSLLAYPLLLEPFLPLSAREPSLLPATQSGLWSAGYLVFAGLLAVSGVLMWRRLVPALPTEEALAPPISWWTRLRWIALALAPSSAMLGVTQYLTTDIAAVPLLWVLPLALYLLTFILAFSRKRGIPPSWWSAALVVLVLGVAAGFWSVQRQPIWLAFPLHLLTLLAVGMVCHGRLAAERPEPRRLTEFYLLVGLGGVLGGAFNALLAPFLFDRIVEYPFALLLACFLRPEGTGSGERKVRALDFAIPGGILAVALGVHSVLVGVGLQNNAAAEVFEIGIPTALCLGLAGWRLRFALGLAVVLALGILQRHAPETLHHERTFFGVLRVTQQIGRPVPMEDENGGQTVLALPFHYLYHGSTHHGAQAVEPGLRGNPTSYYHRTGPIGQVFSSLGSAGKLRDVALVGLGAGALAAYGEPGQRFTFYEIDPAVVRIAREPRYFTYITDARAEVRFVVGDGRLGLAAAEDSAYDLIVIDAFSSDSIPVHLLTREAVALYERKLRPEGVLALHLSNQFVDLEPVVRAVAADLHVSGAVKLDSTGTPQDILEGKDRSQWAALARDPAALAPLEADPLWVAFPSGDGVGVAAESRFLWTDDYSNILAVLKLGGGQPRRGAGVPPG